jgi:hypothetical protein
MAEIPNFDDLMTTCPRCNGGGIEPEPGKAPRPYNPDAFKYDRGVKLCTQCGGRRRVLSPAGEAVVEFLEHPAVAGRIEQACSAFRRQFPGL